MKKTGRAINYRFILALSLICLCIVFIVQNIAVVQITFLFWTLEISRVVLLLLVLLIGLIAGWIFKGYAKRRKNKHTTTKES